MRQFNFTTLACAFTLMLSASVFAQQIEYCDLGATGALGPMDEMAPSCGTTYEVGPAFEVPCEPYEPGIPVCSQCLEVGCDGNCHRICRRLGFYGGAVYDIPISGIFQTEFNLSSTAGVIGVDPLILPGATNMDLMFEEIGFDDIYDGFFGYNANITLVMDRSTKWYVGYKEVNGRADPLEVGQVVIDPLGAATTESITAQFDDYQEWSIQVGFLTSRAMHRKLELLWGGKGSVAMTDAISGVFDIPNTASLTLPLYEDSRILSFGVNLGLRYNVKPNFSLVAVTGAEYRTSLDEDDTGLSALGLQTLNNGGGFVSLPILVGGTINF